MTEERLRSFSKGISWRVIATLTTMSLVWIFTGSLVLSLGIGFFEALAKLLFYYFHERAWNKIDWGKKK